MKESQIMKNRNTTKTLTTILLVLGFSALCPTPKAFGVVPAPDGGYPNQNTAEGTDALFSLTTGSGNTAIGFDALYYNTTGGYNVANGASALYSNTSGFQNVADGAGALNANTTGYYNTAVGSTALLSNTTGHENTALGTFALESNTTGIHNVAIGGALVFNTSGNYNVAIGEGALHQNTTGNNNAANGFDALYSNTTGHENTGNGLQALYYNTTGANNVALGFDAGVNLTTGDNNIDIGNQGVAGESNTIRIGSVGTQTNAYMAGIYQTMVGHGLAVTVDSTGHLGTKGSSARFKDAIKPMGKASEAILALKPVTFRYKKELDPEGIRQFGLLAEDVEKVSPDLVVCDPDGKPYTVHYEAVNAMLLNEFLKEHRTVQKLEAALEAVNKRLKEQDAKIQEVSTRLDASKSSLQMVVSNQ